MEKKAPYREKKGSLHRESFLFIIQGVGERQLLPLPASAYSCPPPRGHQCPQYISSNFLADFITIHYSMYAVNLYLQFITTCLLIGHLVMSHDINRSTKRPRGTVQTRWLVTCNIQVDTCFCLEW